MDADYNLILLKNADKTAEIEFCQYNDRKWMVKFLDHNKVYQYNFENLIWYRDPKIKNHETCIVYENNYPLSGIVKILDFGDYIKLLFKTGYKKLLKRSDITLEETCLTDHAAKNTFEYLKTIANHVSIQLEEDISFLRKQYNTLSMISPRSVLAAYLEQKPLMRKPRQDQLIFPFGFNISQKSATEKAMVEQVSVIEGPPGTGKTQTILNIIANAIFHGQTVAIVSNNNSATANVLEKLQKYGVDLIAAYLGNRENKARFFIEQSGTYPDMNNWSRTHSDFESIRTELKASQQKLNEMLEYQNKRAVLKFDLSNIQTEYAYYKQFYSDSNFKTPQLKSFSKFSSDRILKLLLDYKMNIHKGKFSIKEKIHNLLLYGIFSLRFYRYSPEIIISFLQKLYYEKKINEMNLEIDALTMKLENYDFENEMKEFSRKSMELFQAKLSDQYNVSEKRTVFSDDVLWKSNFASFVKEYPVILSTTHSLRNCAQKNYLFDYVIVDEASQVDIVTGALALSCAKNAVIVGDVKQLPNVVPAEVARKTREIFESFELDNAYNYANQSLLSSFLAMYKDIPKTLLKEHYRCHPKIIGFCNQKFYHNELVILTNEKDSDKPLVLYKTAKGNHARGTVNQRQIDVVFNEIIPQQNIDVEKKTVGVIAPYRLQANELQKVIGTRNIEADTVHKYQGRERDIIILTTVANQISANDFVDNPNLINVAVSRAVEKLIVVVSEGAGEWQGTNIGDLVRYIQYNNFEIIESQVYSVFDLLYRHYSEELLKMLKKTKKVSEYRSENLMNAVIEKVLQLPEFQSLDWVLHQPLRMLIREPGKLTEDERKYAMNMLTHTDFLIYNKLDKMPVLAVEVDGHAFHANNPTQLKRDKMKDDILIKYNIPMIRMKTTESGEEERLRQKLLEILHHDTKVSA